MLTRHVCLMRNHRNPIISVPLYEVLKHILLEGIIVFAVGRDIFEKKGSPRGNIVYFPSRKYAWKLKLSCTSSYDRRSINLSSLISQIFLICPDFDFMLISSTKVLLQCAKPKIMAFSFQNHEMKRHADVV